MGNTGNIISKFRNKNEIHYLDHGFFDPVTHAPGGGFDIKRRYADVR